MDKIKSILINILGLSVLLLILVPIVLALPAGTLMLSGIEFASASALFWFIVKFYLIGIPFEFLEMVFKVLFELTNIFSPKVLYWFNQVIGFVLTTINIHLADVWSDDVTLPLWGKFFGSFLIILISVIFDRDEAKDKERAQQAEIE